MKKFLATIFPAAALCLLLRSGSSAQQGSDSVTIQVRADQSAGTIAPIWNYFGYDEPNYTYATNGKN
jgi:xylan 1,4-beta-xylosidase